MAEINNYLLEEHSIVGCYDLERDFPERRNQMLVAVTEMNTRNEIDELVKALREVGA